MTSAPSLRARLQPALLLLLLAGHFVPAVVAPARAADAATDATPVALTAEVLADYDVVRTALLKDDLAGAVAGARALVARSPADAALVTAAAAVGAAPDLLSARNAFGALSQLLIRRLAAGSGPKVVTYHCPMFETGFAWWIQPKAGIGNPYMGQSMPSCGEEVSVKAAVKAAG